jgi:hybrid cluster-associated redox disulfide protein
MLVVQALQLGDEDKLAEILASFGMECLHCIIAHGESIERAALVHGIDPDELINALNAAIAK